MLISHQFFAAPQFAISIRLYVLVCFQFSTLEQSKESTNSQVPTTWSEKKDGRSREEGIQEMGQDQFTGLGKKKVAVERE